MVARLFSRSNAPASPAAETLVGWVDESPGRGTLSLIISCAFTIFLCTWVVIHPRVTKRPLHRVLHKIALFLKTLVAPECIAVESMQEWSQARNVVKNCEGLTGGGMKIVHAFYIGMLALRYRTPSGYRVIWPNQYTWLLEQRLIDWQDHASWGLSVESIADKSNADGTVKLAALVQVSWFVIQSIMRTAHSLPLSPLESMTLSYIPLLAATYFFWWVKPKDVLTPSVIDLPPMTSSQKTTFEAMAVQNTFDDDGIGQRNSLWSIWHLTPRIFEKEAEDKAAHEAVQHATAKTIGKDVDVEAGPFLVESKEIVLSYWDPELYRSKLWTVICLFGASFGALHLISWKTIFPTLVETWLWRSASLVSIVAILIFMHFEKVVFRWGGPLTMISIISPALYLLGRLIMMAGVIAAFRASDPAIYETYVVSSYWIHML
ncbi:hypothetical protein LOCC1_G008044 [Lachnellula occidentalis]|uniref:Uncharacterized protein n=1 Tax=Lachnellula occidentalis TaxID=215460 RepID=A0A8H8U497_9HELO|nr:hypothetical protein LOCC1_G008044 [Lachnellula occidentalis]